MHSHYIRVISPSGSKNIPVYVTVMILISHFTVFSIPWLPEGVLTRNHCHSLPLFSTMGERAPSSSQSSRLTKSLPASIRSCVEDGRWQIVSQRNTSACTILTEEEFLNKYARNRFIQTYEEIERNMTSHLNRFGLDLDDSNTFMSLLSSEAAEKLCGHLSEQCVKDGKKPVRTVAEFYEIIATMLIRSRFRVSNQVAYNRFLLPLEKSENITLTSQSRFIDIIPRLRGYDVAGRTGDDSPDDTWMQNSNRLRNLEELEEKMFRPSISLMMNKKSGELVLDDELIGSQSSDVECKTLSYRKAGLCLHCCHKKTECWG